MIVHDGQRRPEAHRPTVVFGSGFASREVVRGLVAAGRPVVVVERGGREIGTADAALSQVAFRREAVRSGGFDFGAQVPPDFDGVPRFVGLGGTASLWSGKWRALDEIDMRRRHDDRQWPFSLDELEASLAAVACAYGIPSWSSDATLEDWRTEVEAHDLRLIEIFEQRPPVRLIDQWNELERSGLVHIVAEAGLIGVAHTGSEVHRLDLETPQGRLAIEPRDVVVACGGIESVALSEHLRTGKRGDGARFGGYMDHPKGIVGQLEARRGRDRLAHLMTLRGQASRLIAFALPADEIERDGIGNHTAFLWPAGHDGSGSGWQIIINLEQFPERENFIRLGARSEVSWRISRATWQDMNRFLERLSKRLSGLLGPVRLESGIQLRGASHPAGCLPMGDGSARQVDAAGRVAGCDNVYCASSAVFPVAGSANPTWTVAALGHRLAAHLGRA
ncbi:GMC oxidoreductase [Kaistia terrae]|uniref:GMC oxidoreductase n=1 Tax=Kaistia terrae TaxID=537017 RepID=A0ABW0PZN5_9HYPH|nr:GMC oxidoreductase [Kaistia terrae]MCX5578953.1 GMC oxidoreductase [Kaistia terrae]